MKLSNVKNIKAILIVEKITGKLHLMTYGEYNDSGMLRVMSDTLCVDDASGVVHYTNPKGISVKHFTPTLGVLSGILQNSRTDKTTVENIVTCIDFQINMSVVNNGSMYKGVYPIDVIYSPTDTISFTDKNKFVRGGLADMIDSRITKFFKDHSSMWNGKPLAVQVTMSIQWTEVFDDGSTSRHRDETTCLYSYKGNMKVYSE